jgi:hypothetical protein
MGSPNVLSNCVTIILLSYLIGLVMMQLLCSC